MTPSAEEMSWEAEIQVEVFSNSPDPHIPPEEWKKALEGEEGLEEMLLGDDPSRTSNPQRVPRWVLLPLPALGGPRLHHRPSHLPPGMDAPGRGHDGHQHHRGVGRNPDPPRGPPGPQGGTAGTGLRNSMRNYGTEEMERTGSIIQQAPRPAQAPSRRRTRG